MSPGGYIKKYLKIQIKLHWWLKAFLKLFTIKNVPDVSVAITDLLQGEVKEKILHKSTDINKTLIKIPKYVSFFLVSESQV